jgi:hypothetical protein
VHAARIDLKVSGPIGRVQFLGLTNGRMMTLKTITDPVGSLSIDITDAEALTIDDEGRLALGLSAGESDGPELPQSIPDKAPSDVPQHAMPSMNQTAKVNYWRIESLALHLWAKTTEPTARD